LGSKTGLHLFLQSENLIGKIADREELMHVDLSISHILIVDMHQKGSHRSVAGARQNVILHSDVVQIGVVSENGK
jgi:hypothetical protein